MSAFDDVFGNSLVNEGGWVLNTIVGDRGKQTFAGIARFFHPDWDGWKLIDSGDTSSDKLKQLTKDFYLAEFWLPLFCDQFPFKVSLQLFDMGIHSGKIPAAKTLQLTLAVSIDGLIGPKTIQAAKICDQIRFGAIFNAKRLRYLKKLDDWKKFNENWSSRIARQLEIGAA